MRRLSADGQRIFTVTSARELAPEVGVSRSYVRELLHHLAKSGWVVRLRRGLYAIATTVPGVTPAHEFEVAMHLVAPAAICCWSAFQYHGLTDQVPREVFVLTTSEGHVPWARGGACAVGNAAYRFVQVKPERFFGTETVWMGDARVNVTDLERTLLDGLNMPKYCGDFAEVLHAFELARDRLDLGRITDYGLRLGQATAKRLGWVLENTGTDAALLVRLLNAPITGYRTLDASGPRKGPYSRKWMVQENLPGRIV